MPLSITLGGSPDVNRCVASQTPEDFTTHVEMHPLKHHCQQLNYYYHLFVCSVEELLSSHVQNNGLRRVCFFSKSVAHGVFPPFLEIIAQNIPYSVE